MNTGLKSDSRERFDTLYNLSLDKLNFMSHNDDVLCNVDLVLAKFYACLQVLLESAAGDEPIQFSVIILLIFHCDRVQRTLTMKLPLYKARSVNYNQFQTCAFARNSLVTVNIVY